MQALLELYGAGLERIVGRIGALQATTLVSDELVAHLLLLHGLHPVSVEERVREALDGVRPYLGSHGGDVELVEVRDGVARVRMQGSCEGCPASAMTLKLAIEDAVLKAAPDVERVEADAEASPAGIAPAADRAGAPRGGRDGLGARRRAAAAAPPGACCARRSRASRCCSCGCTTARRTRTGPTARAAEASLEGGTLAGAGLVGAELTCPGCAHRYDVVRAGRCVDAPELHLEPVPLLVDDAGLIRVAVQAGVAA